MTTFEQMKQAAAGHGFLRSSKSDRRATEDEFWEHQTAGHRLVITRRYRGDLGPRFDLWQGGDSQIPYSCGIQPSVLEQALSDLMSGRQLRKPPLPANEGKQQGSVETSKKTRKKKSLKLSGSLKQARRDYDRTQALLREDRDAEPRIAPNGLRSLNYKRPYVPDRILQGGLPELGKRR